MTIEDQNLDGSTEGTTYGQILESSAVIGGSSALTIMFGVVRTKAMALFLGPSGFGLFGVYISIISVTECFAGLGVSSSAVRQIAHLPQQATLISFRGPRGSCFGSLPLLAFAGAALLNNHVASRFTHYVWRHSSCRRHCTAFASCLF